MQYTGHTYTYKIEQKPFLNHSSKSHLRKKNLNEKNLETCNVNSLKNRQNVLKRFVDNKEKKNI